MNGRDSERLELERAGWERLKHEGETVWRNPVSGLVYPQGIAISMLREGADPDVPLESEGERRRLEGQATSPGAFRGVPRMWGCPRGVVRGPLLGRDGSTFLLPPLRSERTAHGLRHRPNP